MLVTLLLNVLTDLLTESGNIAIVEINETTVVFLTNERAPNREETSAVNPTIAANFKSGLIRAPDRTSSKPFGGLTTTWSVISLVTVSARSRTPLFVCVINDCADSLAAVINGRRGVPAAGTVNISSALFKIPCPAFVVVPSSISVVASAIKMDDSAIILTSASKSAEI